MYDDNDFIHILPKAVELADIGCSNVMLKRYKLSIETSKYQSLASESVCGKDVQLRELLQLCQRRTESYHRKQK